MTYPAVFRVGHESGLHLVEGMMNSDKYLYVLEQKVIPEMRKRFTDGSGVFHQDLAPCHTSKKVKSFMDENQIYVLQWPGNFQDLNPIENLWSIIKTRLRNKDCTTKIKLIEEIIQLWYIDEEIQSDCKKLVDSMPKRERCYIAKRRTYVLIHVLILLKTRFVVFHLDFPLLFLILFLDMIAGEFMQLICTRVYIYIYIYIYIYLFIKYE